MQDAPANIGDKSKAKTEHIALLKPRNPFQSFAPLIGGLHIQLNAVEMLSRTITQSRNFSTKIFSLMLFLPSSPGHGDQSPYWK